MTSSQERKLDCTMFVYKKIMDHVLYLVEQGVHDHSITKLTGDLETNPYDVEYIKRRIEREGYKIAISDDKRFIAVGW